MRSKIFCNRVKSLEEICCNESRITSQGQHWYVYIFQHYGGERKVILD